MVRQLPFLAVELAVVAFATVLALVLRENFYLSEAVLWDTGPYLLCTLAAATAVFPAFQTSRPVWQFTMMFDYLQILSATAATVVSAVAIGFSFNRMDGVPRSLPFLQALLMLFCLVGLRVIARIWQSTGRDLARWGGGEIWVAAPQRKHACETVLVVGLNELAGLYLRAVARIARERVRVAGVLTTDDGRHTGRSIHRHQILGSSEQVVDVVRILEVHGVFVNRIVVTSAFEALSPEAQDALLRIEKSSAISLEFLIDQLGLASRRGEDGEDARCPKTSFVALSLSHEHFMTLDQRPYVRVKRALDFIAALVLLIALAPLMAFTAGLVAADVGSPITFWQQRPGRFGRPIKIYKFRTLAPAHDPSGRRLCDEERSSRTGRILRRTRLDELPQLLNILWGDMSFVGPRPLLPVDQPEEFAARLLVRPGLTGWAQIKGGRDISATDKGALDVWYVKNVSLGLDIRVLAQTAWTVIFGETIDRTAIQEAWKYLRSLEVNEREETTDSEGDPLRAAAE